MLLWLLGVVVGVLGTLAVQWVRRPPAPVTGPERVSVIYQAALCDEIGHIVSTRVVRKRDPVIYRYHGRGSQTAYTYRYTQPDGVLIYQVRGYGRE